MAVFLLEILAILIFWRWADLNRLKMFFPVLVAGTYERFLQHFIIADWFHFFAVSGPKWLKLWSPISADLTIWVVVCYLFVQYLPQKGLWLYIAVWVGIMVCYERVLILLNVFSMEKGWNSGISAIVLIFYFGSIYLIWRWLRRKPFTMS